MKKIKFLMNGKPVTVKEVIKDYYISIRIFWRMNMSELILLKFYSKLMDYLTYHYNTKMMMLDNPNLCLLSELYKSSSKIKDSTKHDTSIKALEIVYKFMGEYFDTVKKYEQSRSNK